MAWRETEKEKEDEIILQVYFKTVYLIVSAGFLLQLGNYTTMKFGFFLDY